MKSYLKPIFGVIGLTATASSLLSADTTTTYPVYTTNSYVVPTYSRSSSVTGSSSNNAIVALNAQALMLKEMLQEHRSRAADLTQKNQDERAKWETELAKELQDKSTRLQKSLDEITQPALLTNDLRVADADLDDQLLFISTVEARLEQINKELAAATRHTGTLATQISPDKTPEDIGAISSALDENQRFIKELQREQVDLQLRKIEFRAILKAIQK